MTDELANGVATIGVRLLDNAYMSWFAVERECEHALAAWFDGPARNRQAAYAAYRAALDREQAAACDLQRLWELTQPCRDHLSASRSRSCQGVMLLRPQLAEIHAPDC